MAENQTKQEDEEDKKVKEEGQKAQEQVQEIAKIFTGLGVFDIIDQLYEWAQDKYPEYGFYGHLQEIPGLLSKYQLAVTFQGVKDFEVPNLLDTLDKFYKLFKNFVGSIIVTFIKIGLAILKTIYDTLNLFMKQLASLIQGIVNIIGNTIKAIGNAIRMIIDLFKDDEEDDGKSLWDKFCDNINAWMDELKEKYSWKEIKERLWQMLKGLLGLFFRIVSPYIQAIYDLYNTIESLIDTWGESMEAIKKAFEAFIKSFFKPIFDIFDKILKLLLNSTKNYMLVKGQDGLITFGFTSDTVKNSEGVYINAKISESRKIVNNQEKVIWTLSYIDGETKISKIIEAASVKYSLEDKNLKVSASISGFLKPTSLISQSEVNQESLGKTFAIPLDEDISGWQTILKKLGETWDNIAEQIAAKFEAIIDQLSSMLTSTFLPHVLRKVGSKNNMLPPNFSGYELVYPSVSMSATANESPKVKRLIFKECYSEPKPGEVRRFHYKVNATWIKSEYLTTSVEISGDKLIFVIVNGGVVVDRLVLYFFSASGENCRLISEPQYQMLQMLQKFVMVPIYAFNTLMLMLTGWLYIITTGIRTILKASENTLKLVGVQFTSIIDQFEKAMSSTDDKTFFKSLTVAFDWPKWEEFKGNPFEGLSFEAFPDKFIPDSKKIETKG